MAAGAGMLPSGVMGDMTAAPDGKPHGDCTHKGYLTGRLNNLEKKELNVSHRNIDFERTHGHF